MHAREQSNTGVSRAVRSILSASSAATSAASGSPLHRRFSAASSPATAAGSSSGIDLLRPEALRVRQEKWQSRVLELSELVPEATGAGNFVSNTLSRVKLVVESIDGSPAPASPEAQELQRRMDSFDLGRLAELIFFSGEAFIAWHELNAPEVLSIDEIKTTSDPMEVKDASGKFIPLPTATQVIRVWRPSKRNRYHATSPHKSLMDLLESMYVHQLGDMAVAHSRMISAGILVWPTQRKRKGLDPETGRPMPGSQEELVDQFKSTATKALDASSGLEAKIPFLFLVDGTLDAMNSVPQLVSLEREDYADQYATRYETYRIRYGSAIDLPVEQTTGMGSAKGWTARQISEETWRSGLCPLAEVGVDALNERVAAPLGLRIVLDPIDVIAKPDITEVVMQMLALGNVTPQSALSALQSGDISLLVMREAPANPAAPQTNVRSANRAVKSPSDFQVNGDRGAGSYRER